MPLGSDSVKLPSAADVALADDAEPRAEIETPPSSEFVEASTTVPLSVAFAAAGGAGAAGAAGAGDAGAV